MLNAVQLESTGTHLVAVGTDRFVLGASATEWVGPKFDVLLPLEKVDMIRALLKPLSRPAATYSVDLALTAHDRPRVKVAGLDSSITVSTLDASFPRWRQLVPKKFDDPRTPTDILSVDPRKLAKFARVTQKYDQPLILIRGRNKAICLRIDNRFVGIVMPIRLPAETVEWSVPSWI